MAWMMASFVPSSASATMVPAKRFTSQLSTPETAFVTFSTRAEQAAQVMPVTLNFSFMGFSFPQKRVILDTKRTLWYYFTMHYQNCKLTRKNKFSLFKGAYL